MSDEAPAYFRLFLQSFNAACVQQKESFDILHAQQPEILDKVAVLTEQVASIEASIDARFASVASDVAAVRTEVTALSRSSALIDT